MPLTVMWRAVDVVYLMSAEPANKARESKGGWEKEISWAKCVLSITMGAVPGAQQTHSFF